MSIWSWNASPTTERYDRVFKVREYQRIASVQCILLFASDKIAVDCYQRTDDGWSRAEYRDLNSAIEIPTLSCVLHLSEIYKGIATEQKPEIKIRSNP